MILSQCYSFVKEARIRWGHLSVVKPSESKNKESNFSFATVFGIFQDLFLEGGRVCKDGGEGKARI